MRQGKGKRAFGFLIFIAVFAGITAIVMLLWNALIPRIIGWTVINYWQAAGMIVLCRLLLGGFGKMQQAGHMFHNYKYDQRKFEQMNHIHKHFQGMNHNERREYIRRKMAGFEEDFAKCGKDDKSETEQP